MSSYHTTVLLQEAIEALHIQPGKKYIDGTLGGGGHTLEIAQKGGMVLAIDQDADAIQFVEEQLRGMNQEVREKVRIVQGNFRDIEKIAKENGFESVAGILLDIGISGHQVTRAKRGFSFLMEGPLDMRMDIHLPIKASDLVNGLNKGELIELFTKFGEEPFAKRIAEAIVNARLQKSFETTTELADVIAKSVPKIGKVHQATKVFQALRIAVNDELHALEEVLAKSLGLLEEKGRLVVITFHSLEDRIVKRKFEGFEKENLGRVITKDVVIPSKAEVEANKKARSAKMRVFEKI